MGTICGCRLPTAQRRTVRVHLLSNAHGRFASPVGNSEDSSSQSRPLHVAPAVCPSAVSHSYLTRVPRRSAVLASPTARESSSLTDHRRLARRIGGDFPSNERSPKDLNATIMPAAEMPDMLPDMYASLGVSRSATNTEIRRAYRNLITKVRPNHPPTTPTARPLADLIMQLQNARPVAQPTPTDRLTHTVNHHRSIPIKAATASSSSSSSAPTTSSPSRTNARTTTPPARWKSPWRRNCSKPSAAEHSAIPGGNARRWRRSP